MLFSLGIIFLLGLIAGALFRALKLPPIVGMLAVGILTGPFVLDLLDSSVLGISSDLRRIALVIILIKAGLSLDLADLKKAGRPAVLLSFLPACAEIAAYTLLAPLFFGITRTEAALMGAVLSAVSPAVVVPRMVKLTEEKRGTAKAIPQMILAGASCDDVFVIVVFSSLLTMAEGGQARISDLFGIPVSIALGVLTGILSGTLLHTLTEKLFTSGRMIRNSTKAVMILGTAFLLMSAEDILKGHLPLSGLLAVVSMACTIRLRADKTVTGRLSAKFGKLWIAAELLLFVLVGAAVDIRSLADAGAASAAMIFSALAVRSVGTAICLAGTKLNMKERLFCIVSYIPKATVQAAIGSVPLAMGLPCGNVILSTAVLAIIITAPLGAFGIDRMKNMLEDNS